MSAHEEEEELTPAAASAPTYTYDDGFQQKILALAMRDNSFMSRAAGLLSPSYFGNEVDAALAKVALDFYGRYKTIPTLKSLPTLIKDALDRKVIRSDLKKDLGPRLKELLKTDISDREFVLDEIGSFSKHRAMEDAIVKSVEILDRGDPRKKFTEIEKLMREAQLVGITEDFGEYDYWAEIHSRHQERLDIASGKIKKDGITTGSAELDKHLYHHGWGRRELSVIMGAAKAGKSMSLGEFGKNASLAGYNVLYASCEVAAKIIGTRTDANISDVAVRLLGDTPIKVKEAVEKAAAKAGHFKIHEFPSGTLKPSQLRRLIERYKARGIVFDLIIVDYADIMAPEYRSDNSIDNFRSIYIDLRAIASEENAAVLTATQTNREGAKAMVAKMTDVADDFNKIRTADIIISINSNEAERASGESRLYFAASRNSEDGFTLRIKQDRERMKFLVKVLGKE